MFGEAEEVEPNTMWPARVLLTLDEHFQPSNCLGIQEKQSAALARNGPHQRNQKLGCAGTRTAGVAKLGVQSLMER